MDELNTFATIAPFLTHPLVLIGFVVMMFFGIHRQLIKAGIIPKLNREQGSGIVRLILTYGFWLGLLIAVLGFGLQFYQTYSETQVKTAGKIGNVTGDKNVFGNKVEGNLTINNQYGVPQKALDNLNELLDIKKVEIGKRDAKIQQWVKKYKELETQLASRTDEVAKQAKVAPTAKEAKVAKQAKVAKVAPKAEQAKVAKQAKWT